MKKFIFSVTAFGVLVLSFYALMSFYVRTDINNDYMSAIIDKHKRIEGLNCPKIIFAGGSNLAFGLDSETLEKEFSLPVVNLGLHGGLGLKFIVSELKSVIIKGDVVFLSIEYLMEPEGNYSLKKYTSNLYRDATKYYKTDLRKEILVHIDNTRENIKTLKRNKLTTTTLKPQTGIYSRAAFNKFGDVTAHLKKTPASKLKDRLVLTHGYWTGIDELNEFYTYAKSKGVTVYFIYPNYPASEYTTNKKVIDKLASDLAKNLKLEILNTPSDMVFPDSLFFDTIYHLNETGRELRTKKLIELIHKKIENVNTHNTPMLFSE